MANSRERAPSAERVLIVEADPVVSDLIGRQALQSLGYQVQVAADSAAAIALALQWSPDLILLDMHLPGLSGKDLLVAFTAQGIQAPVIVIAKRGSEADLIQTFRLGAADYLLLPLREAEVVNAVNRALQQVRDRRERDRLSQQLKQANQEMQARVRELTTIFAVGKAMTSITDQAYLMEKILDAAARTTQADLGWFYLREDPQKPFVLVAQRNLPDVLGAELNRPWDDGISSLVAMSGEALEIHGEPLRRFRISMLGQAALIVPIKAHKNVIGLLVMLRRQPAAFGSGEQHLLEALADYASISLVNARLFRALEERARLLQQVADSARLGGKINQDILAQVKEDLAGPSSAALAALERLAKDPTAGWRSDQRQQLESVQAALQRACQVSASILALEPPRAKLERTRVNLLELSAAALRRVQAYARQAGIALASEAPSVAVSVPGDAGLLAHALDGLLSWGIRLSRPGGQITLRIEKAAPPSGLATHISLHSSSLVLPAQAPEDLFSEKMSLPDSALFGGLGIQLNLVKEIVGLHQGKTRFEPRPGPDQGFHIYLPG